MLESILDLEGKKVIILGRSNIVGKPLSFLLTNKNATVTLAHSKSKNLKDLCLSSDIIIAAIGKPNFVKKEWVKENAVIIDVGINVIEDKNGLRKIVGDVDYEDVIKKVSFISPVPGELVHDNTLFTIKYLFINKKLKSIILSVSIGSSNLFC